MALIQLEGANPVLGTPATPFKGGFFGFFDAMRQTSSSLGVLANYRGATYAIIAPLITKPLNFAIKDNIKAVLGFNEQDARTVTNRFGVNYNFKCPLIPVFRTIISTILKFQIITNVNVCTRSIRIKKLP